jgi:multiple sugar transport system substrate-binding protein
MKRHIIPIMVLVLIALTIATGCAPAANTPAPANTSAPTQPTAAAPSQANPVTITVAAVKGVEDQGIKSVIPDWEKKTGNKVELIELPYSDLQTKVFTDAQSGAGSYDAIFIDDPWMPFLASNKYLTALDSLGYHADSDFVQKSLDVASWPPPTGPRLPGTPKDAKPTLYALPALGNVQLFWYRKDMITTPPATIKDMMDAVSKLADPSKGVYGYTVRGKKGNPVVTDFNAWNWSEGGDIFDNDWKVIVNAPKSVQALKDELAMAKVSPPGVANADADEQAIALLNGSTMAGIIWPAYNAQIDDATKSKVSGKIAVVPFPKGEKQTSQLGNWLLGIPTAAKNKAAALDFITYATSAPVMKQWVDATGVPPTRTSVFNDPDLVKKYWWQPANLAALQNATWRPRTPEWSKVEDIMGTHLSQAIAGDADAQAALDAAAKEITDVMTAAGYYK